MSFDNFVQSTLSVALTDTGNILTLTAAVAPNRLPPTDGGVVVLADSIGRPSFVEIISYAARSGLNLTGVVRGLEGTTARAWGIGTPIYQPLTATGYQAGLDAKVDKVGGKGLSTNDYSTAEKNKLALSLDRVLSSSADFTAAINTEYWLATTCTVTLPSYTGVPTGTRIPFSKSVNATPIIQAAAGQNIRYGAVLDTSVQYNINADLVFVFNGTEWEV